MIRKSIIACVIGTRPEAIKMAPVIRAIRKSSWANCKVIATAQHRDMLDQMLTRLDISVDHDLNLMSMNQSPSELLSRMLPALDELFVQEKADIVLAQGDTISVFAAALTAFHKQLNFGHVEAGLRTNDLAQPFPEEGYRQIVSRLSNWHFAPTDQAVQNLINEGVQEQKIHLTGNTGIDTLLETVNSLGPPCNTDRRIILVTAHRRENFGAPMEQIFKALIEIVDYHPDVEIYYPVHPNPSVHGPAFRILKGHSRINLIPPLDYVEFVDLMRRATLILTDSGGIQEEAPALGKPVLVLRNCTERPEALDVSASLLVGTSTEMIVKTVKHLLEDEEAYKSMS
jgi:UDP-N-acetylglucosamine 2-epimerase (non-hydrolysing)